MKKEKRRSVTLEQWVEVENLAGEAVTTLYPSNADLLEKARAIDPPPDLVYRRLNFLNGVPLAYFWITSDSLRRQQGGHCIQRMALETWLRISAIEECSLGGHLGPCGGILPRPKERGGCDCPQCTAATARLEAA